MATKTHMEVICKVHRNNFCILYPLTLQGRTHMTAQELEAVITHEQALAAIAASVAAGIETEAAGTMGTAVAVNHGLQSL